MKKYTVKDNLGNKKTVYAKDLSHALTFVDSKVEDVRVEKGDWFTLRQRPDVLYKVIDDQNKSYNGFIEAMIVEKYKIDFADLRKSHEIKIIKVGNESFHPERLSTEIIRFNSSEEAIEWFKRQKRQKELSIRKHDSTKDEASLATTINALVNDEKAAIDAYNVAIKNLEGSIDDTARQVLVNIRDDERRHIENLYAILNGQVTEKNLKDSIKDGVDEAKKLVEAAGYKVKRAYGYSDEAYITVEWDKSYSELRKKVIALKSEARKIGYKDVFADDNNICFITW